jgi:hypothetical protein
VNWEEVLEKRVKPPVILETLIVDLEVPGDTNESESEICFKTASEGPADKLKPTKCATLDPNDSGSDITFKTACEEPELQGAAHKTQNEKRATVD